MAMEKNEKQTADTVGASHNPSAKDQVMTDDKSKVLSMSVRSNKDYAGLNNKRRDCVGLNYQRRDGATPLWIAAQMGHHDIVSLLLKAGAKEFILTFLVLAGICIFYLYCK